MKEMSYRDQFYLVEDPVCVRKSISVVKWDGFFNHWVVLESESFLQNTVVVIYEWNT